VAVLALLCAFLVGASPPARSAGVQQIGIPAYISPDLASGRASWLRLAQSVPGVGITIANVNSNPGGAFDPDWAGAIQRLHQAGARVIGYVDTGYYGTTGSVSRSGSGTVEAWTAQIHQDVDTWYQFYGTYGLDGIFFDQAPSRCGTGGAWVGLYVGIKNYVTQSHPGALVVANPGMATDPCYAQAADIIVMFEGDYSSYLSWQPPEWEWKVDSSRIWHLVYNAAAVTHMEKAIALSRQRNAGYVYVTSTTMPNPWGSLAPDSYWNDELLQVRRSP
jgi:Spherulation-specific family 4